MSLKFCLTTFKVTPRFEFIIESLACGGRLEGDLAAIQLQFNIYTKLHVCSAIGIAQRRQINQCSHVSK